MFLKGRPVGGGADPEQGVGEGGGSGAGALTWRKLDKTPDEFIDDKLVAA
jgi:hypothetical protein